MHRYKTIRLAALLAAVLALAACGAGTGTDSTFEPGATDNAAMPTVGVPTMEATELQ